MRHSVRRQRSNGWGEVIPRAGRRLAEYIEIIWAALSPMGFERVLCAALPVREPDGHNVTRAHEVTLQIQ